MAARPPAAEIYFTVQGFVETALAIEQRGGNHFAVEPRDQQHEVGIFHQHT